jgi:hypothetical protein
MPPLNLYARGRFVLCSLLTGPRVQRAPGVPCALCLEGKEDFWQTSGVSRREIAKLRLHSSLQGALLSAEARLRAKADATKQSILPYAIVMPHDGLLR